MPVKKKEFELDDGTKITLKQASGMDKLKLSNAQARVFRTFNTEDIENWDNNQQLELADALDKEGCGIEAQLTDWLPKCIIEPADFDIDLFTLEELMPLLAFIRGDDEEGAVNFLIS